MPANISAKLDNIFLIALASTADLKDDTVLNNLNELIVDDLKKLESEGFESSDGKTWKAALVNLSCDNLGANFVMGFSKGFKANYYCRICSMSRVECEVTTNEVPDKLRSAATHQETLEMLNENPNCDLTESEGVRMACLYNNLQSYDIFNNVSLDLMHDVHEGIIPSFLTAFFEHCTWNRIESEQNLVSRNRDFNYGPLFSQKKPSILNMKKAHLGQNACQLYCMILHLPLIFYDLKDKLNTYWTLLEDLLQILQILMSIEITESDLNRLEKLIDRYLSGLMALKGKLIPKEHFLTHYATAIRKMGPLKNLWTMRFESKHKFFTNAARRTHNLVNINKTLALEHQKQICLKKFAIQDNVEPSKKSLPFLKHNDFTKYESFLNSLDENIEFDRLHVLPFLKINTYLYKKGLVLIENFLVYDIRLVLQSQNGYYLLCELFETKTFDHSLNSIQIEPYSAEPNLVYLKLSDLCNWQTFSKMICQSKTYIIAENLTVFNPSYG